MNPSIQRGKYIFKLNFRQKYNVPVIDSQAEKSMRERDDPMGCLLEVKNVIFQDYVLVHHEFRPLLVLRENLFSASYM